MQWCPEQPIGRLFYAVGISAALGSYGAGASHLASVEVDRDGVDAHALTYTCGCHVQFFGALMVACLILVCTAVVMTDRPVWMVGEEPPMNFLRPFSEPPPAQPVYTQAQLKKMATMGKLSPDTCCISFEHK